MLQVATRTTSHVCCEDGRVSDIKEPLLALRIGRRFTYDTFPCHEAVVVNICRLELHFGYANRLENSVYKYRNKGEVQKMSSNYVEELEDKERVNIW